MAKLYFKVGSDWEEVVRLRNEIAKLKQELMSMDGTQSPAAFKALNCPTCLHPTKRLDELVTNAAKAGAERNGIQKENLRCFPICKWVHREDYRSKECHRFSSNSYS